MIKLFTATLFLSLFFYSCGDDQSGKGSGKGISVVPIPPSNGVAVSTRTSQKTPKGVTVFSLNGLSAAQLDLIDSGISRAIENAKRSGYSNSKVLNHTFFEFYAPKEPCLEASGVEFFWKRADNYDGSVFDYYNSRGLLKDEYITAFDMYVKDGVGVVKAVEYVVSSGVGEDSGSFVSCTDSYVISQGAEYGAEHIIVANLDKAYHERTTTHDKIGHPILPKKAF